MESQKKIFDRFVLTPLEKFLRTDTRYLFSGSSWIALGKLAGTAATFILSFAYARYLLKGVYGDYRYIFSIIGIASIFTLPGIGSSIVRSVSRGFPGTFRKGAMLIFLASFGMTLVSFGASAYFFYTGNDALGWGFIVTGVLIPFVEGLGGWRPYLDGKREFRKKTLYNITISLIYSAFMLAAVFTIYLASIPPKFAVFILVFVYLVTRAIPNIILFIRAYRSVPQEAPVERGSIKYGLHLSASNIPSTIATYIDGILLYHLLGPVSLAIYSFAIVFPEQIKALLSSVAGVALSKFSSKSQTPTELAILKKTLPRKIYIASAFTALVVFTYVLIAPSFFQIFFPRYLESVSLSQVFALSLVILPFSFFATALIAEGATKKIYIYRVTTPLIQIVALVILIPIFGLWGAVVGRVVGRTLQNVLLYILYKI